MDSNSEDNSDLKHKYDEIDEYYKFHKCIESYFKQRFNKNMKGKIETFYFIDLKWIEKWKIHTNYKNIINYIEEGYDFNWLIDNNKIKNEVGQKPSSVDSGDSYEQFLKKDIYDIEDFECIVNQSTYDLFKSYNYFFEKFITTNKKIEGILFDKMLILLIKEENKIKIIYKGETENGYDTIQLTLDFPNDDGVVSTIISSIDYLFKRDNYSNFRKAYLENGDCDKLMDFLEKMNMGYLMEKKIKNNENNNCNIINNILYKKYNKKNNILNTHNDSYDNIDKKRFIGLENIGATCYMNATLQCLVNIDKLTRYFLLPNNYKIITNNKNECEILNEYCILLSKLCYDEKIENYFSPYGFKNILSSKNPLFKGKQANDSKDLIYYLFEQMNNELSKINLKISDNNVNVNEINNNINIIQSNKISMLTYFIKDFYSKNNNIIPKLFFSLIENETLCKGCNKYKYNYQIVFSLEFPLEKYYNNIYGIQYNNNNKKKLSIYECFSNYNEINYFQGQDSMFCNICNSLQNAVYSNRIYSLPPILVIILNRGKGNTFNCDVDFPEEINVKQFIQNNKSSYLYKLIGVVLHLGSSDKSGHFIAYCKHRITKEWYCYNDSIVVRCNDQKNGYNKGVPYILFYESTEGDYNVFFDDDYLNNNNNNISNNNISINNNNISNQNNFNNNFINNYQNYINVNNVNPNNNSNNFFNASMNNNNFSNYMYTNNNNNNISLNMNFNN